MRGGSVCCPVNFLLSRIEPLLGAGSLTESLEWKELCLVHKEAASYGRFCLSLRLRDIKMEVLHWFVHYGLPSVFLCSLNFPALG